MRTTLGKMWRTLRSGGVCALGYWALYTMGVNVERIGRLAGRLGNRARIDGIRVRMDSPLIEPALKGELVLGRYEVHERRLAAKYFPLDEPVIELGASIGVMACAVNRRLADPARHVAVEARPELIAILAEQRRINHGQFAIVHAAIAYGAERIPLFPNEGSLMGSVVRGGGEPVMVATASLRDVAARAGMERFNLICDIEGAEVALIEHEGGYLADHVGWIVMELHPTISGEREVERAVGALRGHGFRLVERMEESYCFQRSAGAPG